MNNITIVTGIWDLARDAAGDGFKRPFSHYTDNFVKLLAAPVNMVIFIDPEHEDLVWKHRSRDNTKVVHKKVDSFRTQNKEIYDMIQKIRKDPDWYNQKSWLKESTQATLELYNPVVMNKMFMLHDAKISNPFGTEYFAWIDGGITNTVHPGYFTHDKVFDKVYKYLDKFFFISFPYDADGEVHGFTTEGMTKYAGQDTKYVCRAGFFGGHMDVISAVNSEYHSILTQTLNEGYMGTEESIFTIMSYLDPDTYQRFEIESNGLIAPFFEAVKNDKVEITKPKIKKKGLDISLNDSKTNIYVLGFNSPKQFKALCNSYKDDPLFWHKDTRRILINNSTDEELFPAYEQWCEEFQFEELRPGNIGICGGRQLCAEHFDESDADFCVFLEDDMNLSAKKGVCENGFIQIVPNLLRTAKKIIIKEGFDFLKFSFTEVYGNNKTQWAWYNVPPEVRIKHWPDKPRLPVQGLDKNAPLTKFNYIDNVNGVSYAAGEIYYCNWPMMVTKEGNRKMFIETKWGHPFEQTWMSHIFQKTIKGEINPGILLASPIHHHRFYYYDADERKEN